MIESFGREGDSLWCSLCSFSTVRTVESRGPDRCGFLCPVLLSFSTRCTASPRALHVDSFLLLDAANLRMFSCYAFRHSDRVLETAQFSSVVVAVVPEPAVALSPALTLRRRARRLR